MQNNSPTPSVAENSLSTTSVPLNTVPKINILSDFILNPFLMPTNKNNTELNRSNNTQEDSLTKANIENEACNDKESKLENNNEIHNNNVQSITQVPYDPFQDIEAEIMQHIITGNNVLVADSQIIENKISFQNIHNEETICNLANDSSDNSVQNTSNEQTKCNLENKNDRDNNNKKRKKIESVEFNYLTGIYEKVKKLKEPPSITTLVTKDEENNTRIANSSSETIDLTEDSRKENEGKNNSCERTQTKIDTFIEKTNNSIIYKCFDCNFTSEKTNELQKHALAHIISTFKCLKHKPKRKSGCLECTYEQCLAKKIYNCFDCDYKTKFVNSLLYHSKQHANSKFTCPVHETRSKNCPKCFYQCCLSTTLRAHSTSNFVCLEHRSTTSNDCLECIYSKCLKNLKCKCGYMARSAWNLRTHKKRMKCGRTKCKKTINKFKCYNCTYTIGSKELLKYHMLKLHYNENFECDLHDNIEKNCRKCVYQAILKELKETLFICKNCGFKTYREATFNRHKTSCFKTDSMNSENSGISSSEDEYFPFNNENRILYSTKSTNEADIENEIKFSKHELDYTSVDDGTVETDLTSNLNEHSYDYICYDCPFTAFIEPDYLINHAKIHQESTFICNEHNEFQIFCKRCVYEFTLRSLKMKKIICKYCPKKFETLESALIHMRGNCKEATLTPSLICYDCGLETSTREELFKHSICHKSNYQCFEHETQKTKSCPKCLYSYLVKRLYKCFECNQSGIKSEFDLRLHIETKHVKLGSTCPIINCNKHSIANDYCKQCSIKQIYDKVYKTKVCPICRETCNYFNNHLIRAHKDSIYSCDLHNITNKQYAKCSWCYAEKILEKKSKIWKCCECNFQCDEKDEFELHVVIYHLDKNTFTCSQHSLSDIDLNCEMCEYEMIVLMHSE